MSFGLASYEREFTRINVAILACFWLASLALLHGAHLRACKHVCMHTSSLCMCDWAHENQDMQTNLFTRDNEIKVLPERPHKRSPQPLTSPTAQTTSSTESASPPPPHWDPPSRCHRDIGVQKHTPTAILATTTVARPDQQIDVAHFAMHRHRGKARIQRSSSHD